VLCFKYATPQRDLSASSVNLCDLFVSAGAEAGTVEEPSRSIFDRTD
jgi:hypothetical protein